jgi:hypothetical protein
MTTMEEYITFFSQFNSEYFPHITCKAYDISLFGLAYLKADKYSNMSLIPSSLKIFKAAIIENNIISFFTTITRYHNNNQSCGLSAEDVIFISPYTEETHIPSSVTYLNIDHLDIKYPIKIPPTIKYLTLICITSDFTIEVELEYLYLHGISNIILKTTKPIKFLSIGCIKCLEKLGYIILYVKYLIVRNAKCYFHYFDQGICRFNIANVKCVFVDGNYNYSTKNAVINSFKEISDILH